MKNLIAFVAILLAISCKQEKKPAYSIISGTVENNTGETIFVRGNSFEYRSPIDENGQFMDTLRIKKDGFYELYIGRERTGIYLEKGKNLAVNLNADEFDESLKYTGDLADANNFLAEKYLWNEQNLNFQELFSLEEKAFKNRLDQNKKSIDSIYNSKNINNKNFKKHLAVEDSYARAVMIENYTETHKYYSQNENFEVSGDFYDELENLNFQDTLAYRNSVAYQNLLDAHFNRLTNEQKSINGSSNKTLTYLKKVDEALPDGYAKDRMMSTYLQFGLKPDASLDEAFNIYKNSNPNVENLAKITAHYNKLKSLTQGSPSPTFSFENHNGNRTALADLKGKYVYIDVWATWCGPCLKEIPALKEMEETYRNKNIHFVSISIDEPMDYEKWKAMVSEKKLGGIQLIADNNWNSQFVRDYAIVGIPRFILIDPQGNIVAADAPRPSDPELRKMLDRLI